MGIFREIVDTVKDIGTAKDDLKDKLSKQDSASIARRASEGTMQFPVLVSRTLDIETMQIITKALERNYATFVQVVLSLSNLMDTDANKNIAEYLKKFHQNTPTKFNKFDAVRSLSLESYDVIENENFIIYGAAYEGATNRIVASNRDQLIDLMEDVREDILNNKYTPKVEAIYNFTNPELSKKYNSKFNKAFEDASDPEPSADKKDKVTLIKLGVDSDSNKTKPNWNHKDGTFTLPQNVLKDNDVKKANELIATTLHIRLKLINDKDIDNGTVDFILGVKCTMHPIKSDEMIVNMNIACKNNNKAFNFLRWTTGEISFFKDFLFGVKEMKDDVVNRSKGASPWWITLKRRKALAKLKDSMFSKERILPNATIVISMEEVEILKSEYGYDLFNPLFTNKIMETFFLLGFVVVDNSAQVAHFLFDGQSEFQSVSFSGLEKENTNSERKFKEMLKAINRN